MCVVYARRGVMIVRATGAQCIYSDVCVSKHQHFSQRPHTLLSLCLSLSALSLLSIPLSLCTLSLSLSGGGEGGCGGRSRLWLFVHFYKSATDRHGVAIDDVHR